MQLTRRSEAYLQRLFDKAKDGDEEDDEPVRRQAPVEDDDW